MHAALEHWAADELRSLNAQLEYLLRRALRESGRECKARPADGPGSDAGTTAATESEDKS
jgi:hypothetical protein